MIGVAPWRASLDASVRGVVRVEQLIDGAAIHASASRRVAVVGRGAPIKAELGGSVGIVPGRTFEYAEVILRVGKRPTGAIQHACSGFILAVAVIRTDRYASLSDIFCIQSGLIGTTGDALLGRRVGKGAVRTFKHAVPSDIVRIGICGVVTSFDAGSC